MNNSAKTAQRILCDSGWSDTRLVAVDHWILKLLHGGYDITQTAFTVLRNFGGLIFPVGISKHFPDGIGICRFDPLEAADLFPKEDLDNWQGWLRTSLIPVAAINQSSTLMVDRLGNVYKTYYDKVLSLSGDMEFALTYYIIVEEDKPVECSPQP